MKTVKIRLSCSLEPVGRFSSNKHRYIVGSLGLDIMSH